MTVSAGVASAEDCPDLASLLRRADDALYRAKEAGRNRVVAFSYAHDDLPTGRP